MTFKKVMIRGLLGMAGGVFLGTTIILLISLIQGELVVTSPYAYGGENPLTAFTIQYIVCLLIGFVFAAASVIFEEDRWSIAKQTVLHFIILSVTYIPCAVLAGWVEPNFLNILFYILMFICIYVVIWLAQYFTWKKRIEKLNDKLKNK